MAVGGVVVLVLALVLVISTTGGGGSKSSGGDTVQGYLDALSRGDAEAALSYSADEPVSKDLLTDDILNKQIDKMPITEIRILGDDSNSSIGMGSVHVAAKFGKTVSDATLRVKKSGDEWKLDTAAIKITPDLGGVNESAKSLELFGKKIDQPTVYVFPGYLETSSTSDYVKVTAQPLLLDKLTSYGSGSLDADYTMTDDGSKAVRDEVAKAFKNCERSNQLAPPGCPAKMEGYGLIDGTAVWGPADLSELKTDNFDAFRMRVLLSGKANMMFSAKTTTGDTRSGPVNAYIFGNADMSESPPKIDFS